MKKKLLSILGIVAILYFCLEGALLLLDDSIRDGYKYETVKIGEAIPGTALEFIGCEFLRNDPYVYMQPVLRDIRTGEVRRVFLSSLYTPLGEGDIILSYVDADFLGIGPDGSFKYNVKALRYGVPRDPFLVRLLRGLRYPLHPWGE